MIIFNALKDMSLFHTESQKIRYIIKGLELSKSLFVSSLIIGEAHTGKKTMAKSIFPDAFWVDGSDTQSLKEALEQHNELIISNFNIYNDYDNYDFNNKKIIAISDSSQMTSQMDLIFSFIYKVPSLIERPEDIDYLCQKFLNEARVTLDLTGTNRYVPTNEDLVENIKSLKKAIFQNSIYSGAEAADIEKILYNYFKDKLQGNGDYNKYLPLFEKPLIEAGLSKYKSQLKLASILGINRNTLRKKINELGIN